MKLSALTQIFRRFFAAFSILVLLFSIIGALINTENVLFCTQLLWTALFAFLLALTFTLTDFLSAKKLNLFAVRTIHFILSYASFFLTYIIGGAAKSYFKASVPFTNRVFMIICITFLFIGVYTVIGFVRIGWKALVNRHQNNTKEYQSIYSEK